MAKKRKIEHKEENGKRYHRYEGDDGWSVCNDNCEGGL